MPFLQLQLFQRYWTHRILTAGVWEKSHCTIFFHIIEVYVQWSSSSNTTLSSCYLALAIVAFIWICTLPMYYPRLTQYIFSLLFTYSLPHTRTHFHSLHFRLVYQHILIAELWKGGEKVSCAILRQKVFFNYIATSTTLLFSASFRRATSRERGKK